MYRLLPFDFERPNLTMLTYHGMDKFAALGAALGSDCWDLFLTQCQGYTLSGLFFYRVLQKTAAQH